MASCSRVLLPHFARKQLSLRCCFPKLYSTEFAYSKDDQGEKEIVVPFRIQRGPTDILKALASTVNKDYTAAHYKYHDDPYFIPVSNTSKRSFALSKEAGKKCARYFLENYPDCFKPHYSAPHVQAFDPPVTYEEEDDLDEQTLQNCVKSHDLSNSVTVYKILKKKNISVSQETKQMLLELLCFYNDTPPISEDYYEERWFRFAVQKRSKTWKTRGIAEQLFNDSDKDSNMYCSMILGTAKYNDAGKAFELYEEMRSQNLPANIEVYNSLLGLVPLVKENSDMQWEYAMELVSNLNKEGLYPNLYTLNALLAIGSQSFRWNKGRAIAMQILAEMKRLSIEPSLGSYYHVLKTFFQNNSSYPSVFTDILEKVDGKDLKIQHPDDVFFFVTAMEICQKYLKSTDLAYRLHALLEKGQNSALIGSSFNESVYYQNLFRLLCQNEDFEKFMEFYQKYVPNVYTPEPGIVHEIILAIELCGAYQYLPQIGSDLIMFEHSDRENVVSDFIRIAGSVKHEEEIQKPLIGVAWKILELVDGRQSKMLKRTFQWTGSMLGSLLRIFLNGGDFEKARHVVHKLRDQEASIIGYPENEILLEFCAASLEARDFHAVNICVRYAADSCYPNIKSDLEKVAEDMFQCQKLPESDRSIINTIVEKNEECDESSSIQTEEKYGPNIQRESNSS